MYIVTNRIKMKSGYAEKLAPMFTKGGALQEMKGFIKVETWNIQGIDENDELHVNMWWETLEDFDVWKNSDAFKQAHQRGGDSNKEKGESPMLGSELVIAKVETTVDPK
ncbi:heme oxygenase [Mammaliicoccus sp. Dog046]|uniref:heme oxygenase n=1 Tax=Mammaliicoccus sp. Dog046 TaxID=3034233 RepID=UPI002B25666F|nr:heme oxygenase [Mammaliicoccus sp. Dog046]WQK85835.1 heme oxygenase [Mammaliicoccus sp. Dog046]